MRRSCNSVHLLAELKTINRRVTRAAGIVAAMERRMARFRSPAVRASAAQSLQLAFEVSELLVQARDRCRRDYLEALRSEVAHRPALR